jgi:hypothetical protein
MLHGISVPPSITFAASAWVCHPGVIDSGLTVVPTGLQTIKSVLLARPEDGKQQLDVDHKALLEGFQASSELCGWCHQLSTTSMCAVVHCTLS